MTYQENFLYLESELSSVGVGIYLDDIPSFRFDTFDDKATDNFIEKLNTPDNYTMEDHFNEVQLYNGIVTDDSTMEMGTTDDQIENEVNICDNGDNEADVEMNLNTSNNNENDDNNNEYIDVDNNNSNTLDFGFTFDEDNDHNMIMSNNLNVSGKYRTIPIKANFIKRLITKPKKVTTPLPSSLSLSPAPNTFPKKAQQNKELKMDSESIELKAKKINQFNYNSHSFKSFDSALDLTPILNFPSLEKLQDELFDRLTIHYNIEFNSGRIKELPPSIPLMKTIPKPERKERVKAEIPTMNKIKETIKIYNINDIQSNEAKLHWLIRLIPNNIKFEFFQNLTINGISNDNKWIYINPNDMQCIIDMNLIIAAVNNSNLNPIKFRGTKYIEGELYEPRVKRIRLIDLQLLYYCKITKADQFIIKLIEKSIFKNSESLCPYCEVSNFKNNSNGLNYYFHKMSNSDYLHHLFKHHAVFSNNQEIHIPNVKFSNDLNNWVAICPYCDVDFKMKDYKVDGKEFEHQYLNILRHCDSKHKQGKNLT